MATLNATQQALLKYSTVTENKLPSVNLDAIDQNLLFQYAISNKVLPLVWFNLQKAGFKFYKYTHFALKCIYIGASKANAIYFSELSRLEEAFRKAGILCLPVKGAMLAQCVYKDLGLRFLGDIDFLVRHQDKNTLDSVMKQLSYVQGTYDINTNQITPMSRFEKIKWDLNMSNIFPYQRTIDSEYLPVIKVDFRFALDDGLNHEPVNQMIREAMSNEGKICPAHALVHLCTHLYDEAKQSMNISIRKDINLIKFIDIREYIISFISDKDMQDAIGFAIQHNLCKQMYYSLYFLQMLYNDGYENKILETLSLEIDDYDFLFTYGENTCGAQTHWKKDFYTRLFAGDNKDELLIQPKYFISE